MAGCEVVRVSGYDRCSRAMEDNRGRTVFVYFVGSKDAEGRNWCSDSERAEPIVQEAMKYIPAGAVFIYCQVGDRSYWKDPNNEFRKNLKITAVPTLLKYGAPKQLVEVECSQADLVQKFFAED